MWTSNLSRHRGKNRVALDFDGREKAWEDHRIAAIRAMAIRRRFQV